MANIRININGREIVSSAGKSILDISLENGIDIPHLCYDSRIEPYGGCGLCVVEVEGSPKLARACATLAADGMVIKTNTNRTISTRQAALKLLVSDHRGDCRPPCTLACPGQTDCQGYVGLIANGQYKEAAALIKDVIPLPASIGRICPHPCETACRRRFVEEPVSIQALKAFAGDMDLKDGGFIPETKASTGKNAAVIGAGPAGLTCAYFLAREGHKVTIFEAMPHPGGMLRYGIPQYRLPKDVLDEEISLISKMGVEIIYNTKIGTDLSLEYLKDSFDAVFLGIGAWLSSGMRCKGEDMDGVLGGIDFLKEAALNQPVTLGKKVLVVGGGNTAMDVARTAVRLGAEKVSVIYRRTRDEMPAEEIEIEEAEEEGVEFNFLVAPLEVLSSDGKAAGLRCQKMRLGEADASGRRSPEPIPGEETVFEADTIIAAIGQKVNAQDFSGLELTKWGTIAINERTFQTNIPGVFAGGDGATGPGIAIEAIAQGKNAASVISSYLSGEIVPYYNPKCVTQKDLTAEDFQDKEKIARVKHRTLDKDLRKTNFQQVCHTMTEEEARLEASRCLECGCQDYYECQLLNYIREYDIDVETVYGENHKRKQADEHPFIERNADKCILCGLCIRVCDEIMGVTALGLVDRGFDSVVRPEFGKPLKETACISCGQCASVCPTGACIEKGAVLKPVPLKLEETKTTCGFCGVGCSVRLQTHGNLVYRALPDLESDEGLLCTRGRFGLNHINDEKRLTTPVIKYGSRAEETSWDEAVLYLIKKLQAVRASYGEGSIAFALSPRLTNEEAYVLRKIGEKLDTDIVGSFSLEDPSGLKGILGYDASTTGYNELYNAQMVLSVGRVAENHPVFGIKMKTASGKTTLVSVSDRETRTEEWASLGINTADGLNFLKGILKALIEMGYVDEAKVSDTAVGYDILKQAVQEAEVTEQIRNLAKLYGDAKKAVIVIDEDTVSGEAIKLLADMAVITGKVGIPHRGIILLRSNCNTQGLLDMGVQTTGQEILDLVNSEQVKALVIMGEDPAAAGSMNSEILQKLEFLAVGDLIMTDTAGKADLVLPLVSYAETDGTFTRSDRKLLKVKSALKPKTGMTNLDVFLAAAAALGLNIQDIKGVRAGIAAEIPEYKDLRNITSFENQELWVSSFKDGIGRQLLHSQEFLTSDGKAVLVVPKDGTAFKERTIYDTVEQRFVKFLKAEGLKK